MAHYNSAEWRLYRQDRLDRRQRRLMENHLLQCETCLEAYTNAIEKQELELAELLLPPGFNTCMIRLVRERQKQQLKARRSRLLVNYAAAAVITVALTASGAFHAVVREVPTLLQETEIVSQVIQQTTSFNWSDQLVEAATIQLNKLWETKED